MVHYGVDTPDGSVGIVNDWVRDDQGRAKAMIVAQGWFGRRRFEVPIDKLVEIDHEGRRVVLLPGAVPLEPRGLLQRVVELGESRAGGEAHAGLPQGKRTRPVVCGVADDAQSPTVVSVATRLATRLGAPLVLAHVTPADIPPGVSAVPAGQARLRKEEKDEADNLLDMLLSPLASGTRVKRVITAGPPAATLEDLARREGARFLVIGSAGTGAMGALLKGSVSHHAISHAPCPVVVVPPDAVQSAPLDDEASGDRTDLPSGSLVP